MRRALNVVLLNTLSMSSPSRVTTSPFPTGQPAASRVAHGVNAKLTSKPGSGRRLDDELTPLKKQRRSEDEAPTPVDEEEGVGGIAIESEDEEPFSKEELQRIANWCMAEATAGAVTSAQKDADKIRKFLKDWIANVDEVLRNADTFVEKSDPPEAEKTTFALDEADEFSSEDATSEGSSEELYALTPFEKLSQETYEKEILCLTQATVALQAAEKEPSLAVLTSQKVEHSLFALLDPEGHLQKRDWFQSVAQDLIGLSWSELLIDARNTMRK